MLPLHRKEKLDDVKQSSFPYRFLRPAMLSKPRRRLTPRQVNTGGFLILLFLLWLIFRNGDRDGRYTSPYAIASHHTNGTSPIVDITIQECTRWRWFEGRSKCSALLKDGWEISGGDLLLDMGKNRVHLFVKHQVQDERRPVLTKVRIAPIRPGTSWEGRPGGIWIQRENVMNIKDAITAIDFIHGRDVRELRRGRQFAPGGPLLLGQHINLSYRIGLPIPREFPILKIAHNKPYKVLQVAGIPPLSKLH
jgi:hypothetical protein